MGRFRKPSARKWVWLAAVIFAAIALAVKVAYFPLWSAVRPGIAASQNGK